MHEICTPGDEWNDLGKCDGKPDNKCEQKTIGYEDCLRCVHQHDFDGDKVKDEQCIKCPKGMDIRRGECVPSSRIESTCDNSEGCEECYIYKGPHNGFQE